MARYTCSFTVAVPIAHLQQDLVEVLQAGNLDIIYEKDDYLMAREIPGGVPFAKLVTLEVLIDQTTATDTETRLTLVMKNEELPLHIDNHCYKMFAQIKSAIALNPRWKIIENTS